MIHRKRADLSRCRTCPGPPKWALLRHDGRQEVQGPASLIEDRGPRRVDDWGGGGWLRAHRGPELTIVPLPTWTTCCAVLLLTGGRSGFWIWNCRRLVEGIITWQMLTRGATSFPMPDPDLSRHVAFFSNPKKKKIFEPQNYIFIVGVLLIDNRLKKKS